jgi:hypothetical protein
MTVNLPPLTSLGFVQGAPAASASGQGGGAPVENGAMHALNMLDAAKSAHDGNVLHSIIRAGLSGTPSDLINAQVQVFRHSYFINTCVSCISNLDKVQQRLTQING